MATRLASLTNQRNSVPRKPLFLVNLMVDNTKLSSFFGPRSWMQFNVLHANGTWLQNDVSEWHQNEKYIKDEGHYQRPKSSE